MAGRTISRMLLFFAGPSVLASVFILFFPLSGCGSKREPAFSKEISPDLAVTTLEKSDIQAVASALQFQGTILMGFELAMRHPVTEPTLQMIAAVREQAVSRGRDLDALVQLKHTPVPENLGTQNSSLISALEQAHSKSWDAAVMTFFRVAHTTGMRVMRDLADRAEDPDVRAFAARQLPGIVAMRRHLDELPKKTP